MEAYAEYLLDEREAYGVIEEAPEWLQPYLSIEVEEYARDLEAELFITEAAGGGVWMFDTNY